MQLTLSVLFINVKATFFSAAKANLDLLIHAGSHRFKPYSALGDGGGGGGWGAYPRLISTFENFLQILTKYLPSVANFTEIYWRTRI